MLPPVLIILCVAWFNYVYTVCSVWTGCTFDFGSFVRDSNAFIVFIVGSSQGQYQGDIGHLISSFTVGAVYNAPTGPPPVCTTGPGYYSCIPAQSGSPQITIQSFLATLLSGIIGIILFVLGLGITFSGEIVSSGGSIGASSQGAKQMMAYGVGLIVWSWLTSLLSAVNGAMAGLPFGVWNAFLLILTLVYGFGVYEAGRSMV